MSEDPVRLVDDPSAPAELRADLGRAAEAPAPAFAVEGGLARLSAAIGALPGGGGPSAPGGGAAGTGAANGAGALGAAKASGILGSGVFWGLAACGVAGAAFVWFSPAAPPQTDVTTPVVAQVSAAAVAPPPEPAPPPVATAAAPVAEAPAIETSSATRSPAPSASVAAHREAPAPTTAAEAPTVASDVADEIRDMGALRAAGGDPARALELATAGAKRFRGGVFGQEREAIAIDALARLGRGAEARARAEAFLAAHPKSVYVEQVRRAGHL